MKKIKVISLLCFLVTLFINAQTTITVDNTIGADADYDDLQDAIEAASAGDIIYVQPSEITYGDVIIDKSITLIGYGHSNPLRNTFIGEIEFEDNTSNSRLTGLYINGGIVFENPSLLVEDIVIENCRVNSTIDFGGGTFYEGVNDVLVRGCVVNTIEGFVTNAIITNNIFKPGNIAIYVGGNYNTITISNNIFFRGNSGGQYPINNSSSANGSITVQNCIFYDHHSLDTDNNRPGVIFENCLTYNQGAGDVDPLNGTNNLDNVDPMFVNATDDVFDANFDYNLQTGSPAIGTGTLGVDIGLYDNAGFIFNNFGFTPGVPTVNITAITSQVAPDNNIEVTIESNSN